MQENPRRYGPCGIDLHGDDRAAREARGVEIYR